MIVKNNGKNPNELHDYLIENGCVPIKLLHNRIYAESGITEATEIHIEIEPEKQDLLADLVNQFMSQ